MRDAEKTLDVCGDAIEPGKLERVAMKSADADDRCAGFLNNRVEHRCDGGRHLSLLFVEPAANNIWPVQNAASSRTAVTVNDSARPTSSFSDPREL